AIFNVPGFVKLFSVGGKFKGAAHSSALRSFFVRYELRSVPASGNLLRRFVLRFLNLPAVRKERHFIAVLVRRVHLGRTQIDKLRVLRTNQVLHSFGGFAHFSPRTHAASWATPRTVPASAAPRVLTWEPDTDAPVATRAATAWHAARAAAGSRPGLPCFLQLSLRIIALLRIQLPKAGESSSDRQFEPLFRGRRGFRRRQRLRRR